MSATGLTIEIPGPCHSYSPSAGVIPQSSTLMTDDDLSVQSEEDDEMEPKYPRKRSHSRSNSDSLPLSPSSSHSHSESKLSRLLKEQHSYYTNSSRSMAFGASTIERPSNLPAASSPMDDEEEEMMDRIVFSCMPWICTVSAFSSSFR